MGELQPDAWRFVRAALCAVSSIPSEDEIDPGQDAVQLHRGDPPNALAERVAIDGDDL